MRLFLAGGAWVVGALGYVAVYAFLIGTASFLEAPFGRSFSPFQLNAFIRSGSLAAAVLADFAVDGFRLPPLPWVLAALGVGLISGLGSIAYCLFPQLHACFAGRHTCQPVSRRHGCVGGGAPP